MTITINPKLIAGGMMATAIAMPSLAPAQIHHRRQTENQWRGATYGSAALGALGLITHNGTLTTIGAAGTLYSGYRWQQDMKSRHSMERNRAEWYRHREFYSKGHHFVRHTTYKNGQKYYYFSREK
jgi:hypothetical protein